MQFYDGENSENYTYDENLGIPIMVAASAATKAATVFSSLKSMFGGKKKGKHNFAFTRGVFNGGTPRLFRDNEAAMLVQAYNMSGGNNLGFDVYEFTRRYLGGNKDKAVTPDNIQNFISTLSTVAPPVPANKRVPAANIDAVFSQQMATGKMYTVAEKNELQRRADAAGVPVKQIAWNDKRGGFAVPTYGQMINRPTGQPAIQEFRLSPNMAVAFSRRAGTGREYSDSEKNALTLRGQRIGVSGEKMARIEAGMDGPPSVNPTSGFNLTKLLDALIKPAGAAQPVSQRPYQSAQYNPPPAYRQAYTPAQPLIINRGQVAPATKNALPIPLILGGGALLLGAGYLFSRSKK